MAERAYTIKGEGIAHEVLEGEAILINFKTGSYYSLDGIGGIIWKCLCAGPASASTLTAALATGTSSSGASYWGQLRANADEWVERTEIEEHTVAIAGRPVTLRFAGPALVPVILPALQHLAVPPAPLADLTVLIGDGASTGMQPPRHVRSPPGQCRSCPTRHITQEKAQMRANPGGGKGGMRVD